jgi:hypothetical protein
MQQRRRGQIETPRQSMCGIDDEALHQKRNRKYRHADK